MKFERNYILIGLALLVLLYAFYRRRYEGFVEGTSNNFELKQSELPIHPQSYEPELGLITSGSDFIGLPKDMIPAWGLDQNDYGKMETIDGSMGNAGLGFNLCSKDCCSPQYPPPFALPQDKLVANSGKKYTATPYACNNGWEDSGCLCATEKNALFLSSRGNNGWDNDDIRDTRPTPQ